MKVKEKMSRMRQGWGGKGKDLVAGFMGLFGRDGRIVSPPSHKRLPPVCEWDDDYF